MNPFLQIRWSSYSNFLHCNLNLYTLGAVQIPAFTLLNILISAYESDLHLVISITS